ncbi:transglycosylase [Agaricicola taiwanensis]|uniref:Transglycosylase n=1 Tax=Agaricicola taiwanensis TaxID=591372 RepID=A0A8J2YI77_9RHOB|nr:GlsB/YeaQ/YmgE family stress response membrane protein [Agaricicola taiwanensis]GGE44747.1 transglycosylase [Agaricicola taiwanensis]
MSGVGFFGAIIIGILAGWIAERVTGRDHGLITNLIVGLVGALLGGFVAGQLGYAFAGFWQSLLVSAVGAIVLLFLLGLVRRG